MRIRTRGCEIIKKIFWNDFKLVLCVFLSIDFSVQHVLFFFVSTDADMKSDQTALKNVKTYHIVKTKRIMS